MPLAPPPPDLLPVFNALPGATLLLSPEWVIVGASNDYLAATLTARDAIVGQYIFDAFPDNPQTPEVNAVANVRASLTQVMATRQPHDMAPQHYDVPDRTKPGRFVERYWKPRHTPVLDAAGQVLFIIQSVQDITASRLAERQLREAQVAEQAARADAEHQRTELGRIFQEAPVAMGLLRGPDFVVEWANPRMGQIWGRPLAQVQGRPHFEALPDLASQGFEQVFADVLTGTTRTLEEQLVRIEQDQQPYQGYFNITYQPVYDGPEGITGILACAVEVTEQVLARQELQQLNQELETRVQARTQEALALQADVMATARQQADQRARLYEVFEQTPALIALLRAPGHRYEYVNPAYQRLMPGRQLVGFNIAEAVPEAQTQGFVDVLDRVYRTGETHFGAEVPYTVVPTDGALPDLHYFSFTYQAYREDGQIAGVTIFAFDVTGQVLARQEREAERQQLHKLFMEAPAPIVILDGPHLVFQLINPAYQRIFPGRTLLGKPVLDALPEIAGTAIHQCLRSVFDTGETFVAQELPLMLARYDDGPLEEMFFTFIYQVRRNAHGEVDGVLVFAHEVTDQVQARRVVEEGGQQARALAEQLAEANQQLVRTNVDLDNFIYTASHDLKAPISNIEGLLSLLREELPSDVAEQEAIAPALAHMFDSVERFKRTIDHLTEVSKLQKEHAPASTALDLAAIVEDVRLDLAPLLRETNAELRVQLAGLPPVGFSEKNLRSVVYNLLSNALKYRHPDRRPRVDVRAHRHTGFTVLEVHDNGLGLAAHQIPKLFTMFQRFHDHVEGTGIGLYMIKRMVENAGGRLEVHSQLGIGSTFFVHFPHPAA